LYFDAAPAPEVLLDRLQTRSPVLQEPAPVAVARAKAAAGAIKDQAAAVSVL